MIERCESCGKSELEIEDEIDWYCLDDNAEVTLCESCAKDVSSEFDVVKLEVF